MTYTNFSCILLIAIAAGCQRVQHKGVDQQALRADLTDDLRARATSTKHVFAADSVKFYLQPSQAVPGLSYNWAEYKVPGQLPAHYIYTVAGTRGEQKRLLSTPGDWGSAVNGWKVEDSGVAYTACKELLQVLELRQGPTVAPVAYRSTAAEALVTLGVESSDLPKDTLGDTRAVRQTGAHAGWEMSAWYLLPGPSPELVKFGCEIPVSVSAESTPRVEISRSLAIPSQYQ